MGLGTRHHPYLDVAVVCREGLRYGTIVYLSMGHGGLNHAVQSVSWLQGKTLAKSWWETLSTAAVKFGLLYHSYCCTARRYAFARLYHCSSVAHSVLLILFLFAYCSALSSCRTACRFVYNVLNVSKQQQTYYGIVSCECSKILLRIFRYSTYTFLSLSVALRWRCLDQLLFVFCFVEHILSSCSKALTTTSINPLTRESFVSIGVRWIWCLESQLSVVNAVGNSIVWPDEIGTSPMAHNNPNQAVAGSGKRVWSPVSKHHN